jgi:hypothetical protein
MAIQLTPEQEQRIQAIVNAGAYPSAKELEELLLDGLNSGEAVEADEACWNSLRVETDAMAKARVARKPGR